ncbi:hypothetical protein ACFQX6_41235 [Streptosporangium lutulentum]
MRLTLATEPAYPDRPNEDFIGATPDAVVLLDGAGTPADLESGCSHGIAWYSHTLGSTLLAAVTQSADPLTTILAAGIKATASMHDFCCDLSHPGSPRPPWSCSAAAPTPWTGSCWPTPYSSSTSSTPTPWSSATRGKP